MSSPAWWREDSGFSEEERALIAMKELREIDPTPHKEKSTMDTFVQTEADRSTFHAPVFTPQVPDGFLQCRDCGGVFDIFGWVSTRCVPRAEG